MISAARITSQYTSSPKMSVVSDSMPPWLQEAVHPGALGEHVEVDRAQAAHHGEFRDLGQQPAGDQHRDREREARQEGADLGQECAHRFQHHVDFVHASLLFECQPASARIPSSGVRTQPGRLLIS